MMGCGSDSKIPSGKHAKKLLKMTIYSEFSHWTVWFSIVMLAYRILSIKKRGFHREMMGEYWFFSLWFMDVYGRYIELMWIMYWWFFLGLPGTRCLGEKLVIWYVVPLIFSGFMNLWYKCCGLAKEWRNYLQPYVFYQAIQGIKNQLSPHCEGP
jgi:hypothetical protein